MSVKVFNELMIEQFVLKHKTGNDHLTLTEMIPDLMITNHDVKQMTKKIFLI